MTKPSQGLSIYLFLVIGCLVIGFLLVDFLRGSHQWFAPFVIMLLSVFFSALRHVGELEVTAWNSS